MNFLLAGGSGMIGRQLSALLTKQNHKVAWLTRSKVSQGISYEQYLWDINEKSIDINCLKGIDIIINLAGEGIADKRWTEERKKEIIESRVKSTALLFDLVKNNTNTVRKFISSSAIGFYSDRGDDLMVEECLPANDFLGKCCQLWENEVVKFKELKIPEVRIRTGVVLSLKGGALPKILAPAKFGFGAALGSGKQWMSWIHIDDLCKIFIYAAENEMVNGAFNAVAPRPVTNLQFTKTMCEAIKKPFWMPNVPEFALKLAFGEMSLVVLGSTKCSAEKIEKADFNFQYPQLNLALKNLLGK